MSIYLVANTRPAKEARALRIAAIIDRAARGEGQRRLAAAAAARSAR
jgi:hypothetical protein